MSTTTDSSKGLAIASLVLGIIALVGSFIPLLNILAGIIALVALIMGIVGIAKKQGGMAIAGLILSILSFVITFIVNVGILSIATLIGTGGVAELGKHLNDDGIRVASYTLDISTSPAKVTGTIINETGKDVMTAIVGFDALDENGEVIGDGACTAVKPDKFAAGDVWEFEANCTSEVIPADVQVNAVTYIDTPENIDLTSADIEAVFGDEASTSVSIE